MCRIPQAPAPPYVSSAMAWHSAMRHACCCNKSCIRATDERPSWTVFRDAFMKRWRISPAQLMENSSLCWRHVDIAFLGIQSSTDRLCVFAFVWIPCKVLKEATVPVCIYGFNEYHLWVIECVVLRSTWWDVFILKACKVYIRGLRGFFFVFFDFFFAKWAFSCVFQLLLCMHTGF